MKENQNEKVYVYIRVKPYVYKWFMKRFHNSNFSAIKFPKGHEVYKMIRNRLIKPHDWRANHIEESRMKTAKLQVELNSKDFECVGYDLSLNDEREISTLLEEEVQKDMLLFVSLRYMMGMKLEKTCERWLEENEISTDDWQLDTVRRMCTRAGLVQARKEYLEFVDTKLAQIVARFVS